MAESAVGTSTIDGMIPMGFQQRIALRGVTPTSSHLGRFVVLIDALPDDAIGRAYIAGACLARVRMLDEAHKSADIDNGQSDQLASAESGAASLLWIEPIEERDDPAIAWAVIRFGGGGASGFTGMIAVPKDDFTWNDTECRVEFTTLDLDFENGLLKTVTEVPFSG